MTTPPLDRGATLAVTGSHASAPSAQTWQQLLAGACRDLDVLWQLLELSGQPTEADRAAAAAFPLVVPAPYLERMRRGDREDPLLRQVLACGVEQASVAGYGSDPVGESMCQAAPGLLQKYRGRALLVTTASCAVHCRYCFRRHYPYQETERRGRWWQAALEQIASDPQIDEIILSGGDPLVLSDRLLTDLITDLAGLPQLKRLRLHTRLPVVIPQRVTTGLVAALSHWPRRSLCVIHANHAQEIDQAVADACGRLQQAGVSVFNQTVLLAGVNDSADDLYALSEALDQTSVLPYYLHQLDPVAGAAHFAVPDERARRLVAELRQRLPGYLVPRLVREIPGEASKTPL